MHHNYTVRHLLFWFLKFFFVGFHSVPVVDDIGKIDLPTFLLFLFEVFSFFLVLLVFSRHLYKNITQYQQEYDYIMNIYNVINLPIATFNKFFSCSTSVFLSPL